MAEAGPFCSKNTTCGAEKVKINTLSRHIRSGALTLAAVCLLEFAACPLPAESCAESADHDVKAFDLDAMAHPDLKAALSAMPQFDYSKPEEVRKIFVAVKEAPPQSERVAVCNKIISPGGIPDLRVRIYRPKNIKGECPAVLWFHGGGHIIGVPEQDEAFCLRMAEDIGCIVVSPDYRLAPENPYPADIDDCFAALKWLADKEANGLPVDTDRIAVAGASSGGGLAIAAALKARDEGGPKICFMLPVYPMLDYRNSSISARQITDTRVWCHSSNGIAWKMYLGDMQNVPAYASPAMADDVAGLPPANIVVGSLDPFRDEDIGFAQRMLDAGVPVELRVIPGAFHIFDRLGTPLSEQAVNGHIAALKNALKK